MAYLEMKMDLNELIEFGKRLTDGDLFREYCVQALEQAANDFIREVKKVTPKYGEPNPITGRAWNWPRYPDHPRGQLREAWTRDNPDIRAKVKATGSGFEITLVNNTEYASWVERGHRKFIYGRDTGGWVMGSFFLKRTEVKFENGELERSVMKKLKEWIKVVVNGK